MPNLTRRLVLAALSAGLLSALLSPPTRVLAQPAGPAAAFVQGLGDEAMARLTEQGLSDAALRDRFREMLMRNFDVDYIGKFVLGQYWRTASEAEQAAYLELFREMIVETYTQRFRDYAGEAFEVTNARQERPTGNRTEGDWIVESRIVPTDASPITVEWRVRPRAEGLKVIDVSIAAVSMSVSQRQDFESVIQSNGGGIEPLLQEMRRRVEGPGR